MICFLLRPKLPSCIWLSIKAICSSVRTRFLDDSLCLLPGGSLCSCSCSERAMRTSCIMDFVLVPAPLRFRVEVFRLCICLSSGDAPTPNDISAHFDSSLWLDLVTSTAPFTAGNTPPRTTVRVVVNISAKSSRGIAIVGESGALIRGVSVGDTVVEIHPFCRRALKVGSLGCIRFERMWCFDSACGVDVPSESVFLAWNKLKFVIPHVWQKRTIKKSPRTTILQLATVKQVNDNGHIEHKTKRPKFTQRA